MVMLPPYAGPPSMTRLALACRYQSLRPHLLLNNLQEVWPPIPALLLAPHAEVDDVAVMRVRRAGVHLLAADVGEDHLPVPGVPLDQPAHLGQRCRHFLPFGVVEGEADAEHVAADEALTGVGRQPGRVVVAAAVEQEGGDRRHFSSVESPGADERSLGYVDHADHDRGQPRPLDAFARAKDLASMVTDPTQSASTRIALSDGVRGDEAERAILANQT